MKRQMRKLLLIPTVLTTGFLAFVFLTPATAAAVLRSVAPAAQITLPSTLSAGNNGAGSSAVSGGNSSQSEMPSISGPSLSFAQDLAKLLSTAGVNRSHDVSTAGRENCGRFGNGHHGGKHDFTCPNQHFPPPAS